MVSPPEEVRPLLEKAMDLENKVKEFVDSHLGQEISDTELANFQEMFVKRDTAWKRYREAIKPDWRD